MQTVAHPQAHSLHTTNDGKQQEMGFDRATENRIWITGPGTLDGRCGCVDIITVEREGSRIQQRPVGSSTDRNRADYHRGANDHHRHSCPGIRYFSAAPVRKQQKLSWLKKNPQHDINDVGVKNRRSATYVAQPSASAGGVAVDSGSVRSACMKTTGECPVTASHGNVRNVATRTASATNRAGHPMPPMT